MNQMSDLDGVLHAWSLEDHAAMWFSHGHHMASQFGLLVHHPLFPAGRRYRKRVDFQRDEKIRDSPSHADSLGADVIAAFCNACSQSLLYVSISSCHRNALIAPSS